MLTGMVFGNSLEWSKLDEEYEYIGRREYI